MDIGEFQLNLIKKLKLYALELKNQKISLANNSYIYVATWGENLGLAFLKYKVLKISNFVSFFKIFLKDILFGVSIDKLKVINKFTTNSKKKLILSNATINDFNVDGSYTDRYFKLRSNLYPDFIFIIIYSGNKIPDNINENLILIKGTESTFLKKIIRLKLLFFKTFFFYKKKNLYKISGTTIYSEKIINILKKTVNINKFEKIFFPYEGLPFQQALTLEVKKINKDTEVLGYDHSAPHANPVNLLYRDGSPDKIFVNGESQKDYLIKNLDWPEKKVKVVPSLRYHVDSDEKFENKIYLPWQIINPKIVLQELKLIFQKSKTKNFKKFDVRIHPVCVDIKKQLKLKKDIEKLINVFKEKFGNPSSKTSIFIGSTTSVILALEKDIDIIHICFDPLFDSYSEKVWRNLKVNRKSNFTFEYILKEKNSFIKFGHSENSFSEYYDK
tara:strand:+ start:5691 stop:7022 length:1332 start_codon:yes stop_codon:yes gene_type:complete